MINNLLLNYQNNNEFVCSDGRMSVNGICAVDQQDSLESSDTIQNIIDLSKNIDRSDTEIDFTDDNKIKTNKILDDIAEDGTADYFPDLGKEKKKFSWDMDKPSKVKNFTNTMSDNINAYNSFIEENLGIPVGVQTGLRIGASAYTLGTGGSLVAAAGPFAFPILFGGALKKKERERIERITDQDTQGDNKTPIDMMTYDIPAYGDPGFNIHNDKKDQSDRTPQGPSNQQQSDFGYESDYGFI